MATKSRDLVGATFHSYFADGNPRWKVVQKVGPKAWKAVCEGSDWKGQTKLFSTQEILAAQAGDKFWDDNRNSQKSFYGSLKIGQTVHYCDGFGKFVECVVAERPEDKKKMLRPVALKGAWRDYDLPQRFPNGSVRLGYHAEEIMEGRLFEPNLTTILESPECACHDNTVEQVAAMPRIDLSLPEESLRQQENRRTCEVLEEVLRRVETAHGQIGEEDPIEIRKRIVSLLTDGANKLLELG